MPGPAWFETIAERDAYRGRSSVRIETVRTPDGLEVEREVVDHDDAVAVVPVTDDGDVLLLRQYRQPLRRYLLEIPAGTLDVAGEDVDEAAVRELIEEVGHAPRRLERLGSMHNSAGWSTERTHLLLAVGLEERAPSDGYLAEAEEADMEIVRLPVDDAIGMARRGELTDAKTLVGLMLAGPRLS